MFNHEISTANDRLDLECRFTATGETGDIEGVAVRYGVLDTYRTEFAPSAFGPMEGRSVPMLWSHDPSTVIGSWSVVEDRGDGLFVRDRLNLAIAKAVETRALLAAGDVRGLSIGFRRLADEARQGGGRRITRAQLVEISVVATPSVPGSGVTSVRNAAGAASQEDIMSEHTETAPDVAALDARFANVETRLDERITTELRGLADRLAAVETRANRPNPGNPGNPDAEIERRAFENFCRRGVERMVADEVRALTASSDTGGGYTVLTQFLTELQRNLVLFSPIRNLARITPVSGSQILWPKRTGTLTTTWSTETTASTSTSTQPSYGQDTYNVFEMKCFVDISNQLLEDSAFNMEAELATDLAEEFGRAEGAAFVAGDGVTKPAGLIFNADIEKVTSDNSTDLIGDDILDVFHALPSAYAARTSWGMNRATIAKVRKIKNTTGDYLWQPSLQNGNPGLLLGRPVVELPDMPDAAASVLPIIFGDFNAGFRIFDRVNLSILRDPYSQATNGLVRFHARRRVGGGVNKPEAFKFLEIKP